jgi:hypothetical protein
VLDDLTASLADLGLPEATNGRPPHR